MCLILIAIDAHPEFPLIIAANRDEFYARASNPLAWWKEDSQLIGGQDLESGGSWLALSRTGSLAAVTNYREAGSNIPQRPSRGDLVKRYLQKTPLNWESWLKNNAQSYNGFNLIYGQWNQLKWFSNRNNIPVTLKPGIYGLCNSLLDTPWPKVMRGKTLLQHAIKQKNVTAEDLLKLLQDEQLAPDDKLPDTGIGQEWERLLSSIFIRSETYGTRASTILMIDRQQQAQITERSWLPNGTAHDISKQLNIDQHP